jgi:phosphatidylglycerophosphate synthase
MDSDGNKLPEYYDDPIDIFYKKYIDVLNPHFKDAGMTPNMITTLSFLFGILTCYLYYNSYYVFAGLSYIVSYFFDVMDGYFARKYNMGSVFGSYYDVISDWLITITLSIMFFNNNKIKINTKLIVFILIALITSVCIYHVSCQEKYIKSKNKKVINVPDAFVYNKCYNFENMKYTRFIGTGMTALIFAITIGLHVFFATDKK